MQDFEQLGAFYLGHRVLEETVLEGAVREGETTREPILYDAKDLTTHGLCVGMTGSGKTGLSVVVLEEAALDGVPAIAIDPKGDLGNLLLTFPELGADDFAPWIDPAEATRHGRTPEAHAEVVAARWREGLAAHGQDGARIGRFEGAVERVLYTPGSESGRPLNVLGRFAPPAAGLDADARREAVSASASALCALLDVDPDPLASSEHILLSTILSRAWAEGRELELADLVRAVLSPPFDRVGALPLDDFCSPATRKKLAMKLNHLLASPGFAPWLAGEELDVAKLLWSPEGKPRLSILSIAHLSERERMFFVTLLLQKVIAWMRAQPGTSSLRALLFMDEVFGFFPPVAEPPSKRPMLTLLKQARAYGLGVLLSTQNPVDLDYKGLSNCGTWWLGRLSTERDVDRVMEGLAGAAQASGAAFDPDDARATLAGLSSRRFWMRNVHDDAPVVFETRWAMSYLRGPMTRAQLASLTDAPAPPVVQAPAPAAPAQGAAERPALSGVREVFRVPLAGRDALEWRPAALAAVQLHFAHRHSGLDLWLAPSVLAPLAASARDTWAGSELLQPAKLSLREEPPEDGRWVAPPRHLTKKGGLKALEKALKTYLAKSQQVPVYRAPERRMWSEPGEPRADFAARLTLLAREDRDRELGALREKHGKAIQRLQARVERAESKRDREEAQYDARKMDTAVSVGASVIGALFGRSVLGRATTAARGASRAARERGDVQRAEEDLRELERELRALEAEAKDELEALRAMPVAPPAIEERLIRPRKSDLTVDSLALCWLPYRISDGGEATPGW